MLDSAEVDRNLFDAGLTHHAVFPVDKVGHDVLF